MPQQWEQDAIVGSPAPAAPSPQPSFPGVVRGRTDPYKQANEQRAQQDQVFQAQSQSRADQQLELSRQSADRAARAADRAETTSSRLSVSDNDALRRKISAFAKLYTSAQQFNDDFSGLGAGIENTIQAHSPIAVGTPGQRDWWANFASADNLVRNELFGASLSGGEKSAYGATTVSPGMNPTEVRSNITRRVDEARGELSRIIASLEAAGYNKAQIDALVGEYGPVLRGEQAAPQQDRQDGSAPPAFNGQGPGDTGQDMGPAGPLVNAGGQIAGNVHDNGTNGAQQIADSSYTRQDNPALSGVRDEYIKRLAAGQSAEELIRWAKTAGVDPSAFSSIAAQAKFRRDNPSIAIGEYDTSQLDDMTVRLDPAAAGLSNLGGRTAIGAGLIGAADAASGFTLDNLIEATGGNGEQARLGMEQVANAYPTASLVGNLAGGTAMALGGEAALGARGMAAGIPRAMIADSAYGAAAGAGATDYGADGTPATAVDRLKGAAMGAGAGAAGSYGGAKVGNALTKMATGVADASVNALRREGVNALTVGQTFGNSGKAGAFVKGAEDRLAGLPIVGDAVNSVRSEGYKQFNSAAFNRALEPIGGTVGDVVGEQAIESAQQQVSDAFTAALAGKGAVPDAAFARDLNQSVMGLRSVKRLGDEVTDEVADILRPYANEPMLTGEALDDISRSLRDVKARYMSDPLGARLARQLDRVERSIFDLFDRQASGTVQGYQEARAAYRRLSVLEDAVNKSRNQKDRIFTPAQLGQSDRANTVRYGGKRAAARGDTPFYDIQTAAQDVLPNKVPDSGTAGRMIVPLALVGGGGAADASGVGGGNALTIGAVLASLYTKTGQRILTKPGRGMAQGITRKVLESKATRRAISATGAAGSAAALTDQR